MNIQQILDEFPNLSVNDLLALNKAAAMAWNTRSDEIRRSFKVGTRVTFLDQNGTRQFGNIKRILRKNIVVDVRAVGPTGDVSGINWRVSPGVLDRA